MIVINLTLTTTTTTTAAAATRSISSTRQMELPPPPGAPPFFSFFLSPFFNTIRTTPTHQKQNKTRQKSCPKKNTVQARHRSRARRATFQVGASNDVTRGLANREVEAERA